MDNNVNERTRDDDDEFLEPEDVEVRLVLLRDDKLDKDDVFRTSAKYEGSPPLFLSEIPASFL